MHNLTASELQRYSRHLVLRDFGVERQMKLRNAKILVVGAGGLGCPALLYLAAAGVGTVGIIDSARLAVTNPRRPASYTVEDLRQDQARAAPHRLRRMIPHRECGGYEGRPRSSATRDVIGSCALVIDGPDKFI